MSLPDAAEKGASAFRSEAPTPDQQDQRFPRQWRLTARRQYLAVYGSGRRVGSASFTLFGLRNSVGHCRLGLTVSRKIGGAVARNRVKRVLRDVFRRNRAAFVEPLDVVVNTRPSIVHRPSRQIERELVTGIRDLARRTRR